MAPVNGQEAVEGTVFLDPHFSVFTSAQHRLVFVDRGTVDGVAPEWCLGPFSTVIQSTIPHHGCGFHHFRRFHGGPSLRAGVGAVVIRSLQQIKEGDRVVLMTDVSDLLLTTGPSVEKNLDGKGKSGNELDELDQLDTSEGLGADEAKELKQLETYKGGSSTSGDTEHRLPAENPPPPEDAPPPENGDPEAAPPPDASGSLKSWRAAAPDELTPTAAGRRASTARRGAPPPEEPPPPPAE